MDDETPLDEEGQSEDEVVITSAMPGKEINVGLPEGVIWYASHHMQTRNNELKERLDSTIFMDENKTEQCGGENMQMNVVKIPCKNGIQTEDVDKIYSYIPQKNSDDFREYCDLISYTRSHVIARYDKTSMLNTKLLVMFEFPSFLCRFEFLPEEGYERVILAQRTVDDTDHPVARVYVSQEES